MIKAEIPVSSIHLIFVDEMASVANRAASVQVWVDGRLNSEIEAIIAEEKGSDGGYYKVVNFRKVER